MECPDAATVNQTLAIFGRGVPVITRASWVMARGDPECVPAQSVMRYVPLVGAKKVVFKYDEHFRVRSEIVFSSLKELSTLPKSKWEIRSASVSAVGESGYATVKLIASEGVGVLRSWLAKHRRIVNASGPKAWSTQRLF